MHRTCWMVALCGATLTFPLLSCQSHPAKSPMSPNDSAFVPVQVISQQSSYEGVAAEFALNIDAAAGTADATPIPLREGQKQGFIFDLDISSFLTKDSFRIAGVERQADGDLEIFFTHAHPFGAPDFTRPVSGTNRADLGYTGRAVILADRSTNSFFGGTITLDPTTVADADGYANVAPLLLSTVGLDNNTFPYVLLADEAEDNRVGIANGGVQGNYNAAGGGWDRLNIGANRNGWTGYDFVHQGQTIRNSITITQDALQDGDLSLRVALVIKYCDPRGGATPAEQKPNRFPTSPADPFKFAYRLPHAALDVSSLKQTGAPVGMHTNINNCTALTFTMRDWDVLGVPGNDDNLSDDTSVETIVPGSDAMPTVVLDAPVLFTSPRGAILTGYNQGLPGAEMQMGIVLKNELATAPAGQYWGCIRAEDPENAFDEAYHYGVDPVTLAATRSPLFNNYLPIPISLTLPPANAPSTPPQIYSLPCEAGGPPLSTRIFAIQATNTPTTINWDFGGGANPNVTTGNNAIVTLAPTPGIYVGTVSASNAFGSSGPSQFIFEVSGTDLDNPPPHVTVRSTGVVQSGDGVLIVEVTDYTNPSPGSVTIQFDWNNDGDYADTGEASQPLSGPAPIPFISPITFNSPSPVETLRNLPYRFLYTTVGNNISGLHQFRLGANRPPEPLGAPLLVASVIPQNGFFTIATGSASANDPEGDPVTYKVYDNLTPGLELASGPTFPLNVGPYNGTPSNQVTITIYATDAAHPDPTYALPFLPAFQGYVQRGAVRRWNYTGTDTANGLVANGGSTMVTGRWAFNALGGGACLATSSSVPSPSFAFLDQSGVCNFGASFATGAGVDNFYARAAALSPNGNMVIGCHRFNGFQLAGKVTFVTTGGSQLVNHFLDAGVQSAACDSANNAYVGFYSSGSGGGVNFHGNFYNFVGGEDSALIKYNSAGVYQSGVLLSTAGNEYLNRVHVDVNNNVYVTLDYDTAINFGGGIRTSSGLYDSALIKYNSSLAYQWDRLYQSTGSDSITGIDSDISGNLYLSVRAGGPMNLGGGLRALPAATTTAALVKLSPAGNHLWDRTYPGTGASSAYVTVTSTNTPVLGGYWDNSVDLGGGARGSVGSNDCFLLRLDANGNYIDDLTWGSTGSDYVTGIDAAPDGSIRIIGHFHGTVDFFEGPAVLNLTATSPSGDPFWMRVASDGSL